jgi:hypothetical protein
VLRRPGDHDSVHGDAPPDPPGTRRIVAAAAGFLGMVLVVLGAALPSSPFTSKLPGAWIFGIPAAGSTPLRHELLAMAVVYAGLIIVLGAWYCIATYPASGDPRPVRRLSAVLVW